MKYSISIPLNNEVFSIAKECQKRIYESTGASIMKNNSNPHINIISGTTKNLDEITSVIKKIKIHKKKNIDLFGLGIFLTPEPLLYLRFKKSLFIEELRHSLLKDTLHLWQTLSTSVYNDVWLPKCTLAYHDLSLDKLSDAITCLNGINFINKMEIMELSIIDFTTNERQIDIIQI